MDAPDGANLTPLFYSAVGGHSETCLRLLLSGANPNVYDESGKGPLHSVIYNDTLDQLIPKGLHGQQRRYCCAPD